MALYTGSSRHLGGTETVTKKETFFYGLVQENVLLTGAYGQLGREIERFVQNGNFPFRFFYTDSDSLDITDRERVFHFIEENSIRFIVNAAAYTAVDKAEEEPEIAFKVNHIGVENLARAAAAFDAKLLHISTDYLFDGNVTAPYRETDSTNPISVYGLSKLKGEEAVQAFAKDWIILRTSWMFSEFGNNFVKTMIRLMNEKDELNIVSDQRGTPTYARDLAEMILLILEETEWKSGIYHFSNRGETTWYDFARKIQELNQIFGCKLNPISSEMYKTAAKRPKYSVLDKSKIESEFHVVIPDWEEALERFFKEPREKRQDKR